MTSENAYENDLNQRFTVILSSHFKIFDLKMKYEYFIRGRLFKLESLSEKV